MSLRATNLLAVAALLASLWLVSHLERRIVPFSQLMATMEEHPNRSRIERITVTGRTCLYDVYSVETKQTQHLRCLALRDDDLAMIIKLGREKSIPTEVTPSPKEESWIYVDLVVLLPLAALAFAYCWVSHKIVAHGPEVEITRHFRGPIELVFDHFATGDHIRSLEETRRKLPPPMWTVRRGLRTAHYEFVEFDPPHAFSRRVRDFVVYLGRWSFREVSGGTDLTLALRLEKVPWRYKFNPFLLLCGGEFGLWRNTIKWQLHYLKVAESAIEADAHALVPDEGPASSGGSIGEGGMSG